MSLEPVRNVLTEGSVLAVITGSVGAMARWFSEIMHGQRAFSWLHFPMLVVIGAFMGYMGNELAYAMGAQKWASLFAGVSGAMGSYGFEFYFRVVERVTGLKPNDTKKEDDKDA